MILDEQRKEKLNEWLNEIGELYVDVYQPNSGASSTDYLLRSIQELEMLIAEQAWHSLTVTVFRKLQFPLRGIADNELLKKSLQVLPDNWYDVLLISDEGYYPSSCIHLGGRDSHQELRQEYSDFEGLMVGIGQNPFDYETDWIEKSPSEAMVIKLKRMEGSYIRMD